MPASLTLDQELNSVLHAWRRMRGRAAVIRVGRERRAAADKRLRSARSALLHVRTAVALFASPDQRARFERHLDEVGSALDSADVSIARDARPPHREADPSLRFLIKGCRTVMQRHRVNEKQIARYLIQQVPKMNRSERDVIFSAEPHRTKAAQIQEAEKRLAGRLRKSS